LKGGLGPEKGFVMHLADQLLSAKVYVPAAAAAALGLSLCAARIRRGDRAREFFAGAPEDDGQSAASVTPDGGVPRADRPYFAGWERSSALMGVMGAFIFAAQMINFPILPGTTGHLCGGVLLAILFGPCQASILMASILVVQCLIFQDGGLLALGANIINMGLVPCFVGTFVYHLISPSRLSKGRAAAAPFLAAFCGVMAGAFLVPFEVCFSGVAAIPLGSFLTVMLGIHALIAFTEGVITVAVLKAVRRLYPRQVIGGRRMSRAAAAGLLFATALVVGGGLSVLASHSPDGLEKAVTVSGYVPSQQESGASGAFHAPLPDYSVPGLDETLSSAVAGLAGTAGCFGIIFILLRFAGKKR